MTNELIFLGYIFAVSSTSLIALTLGKEALIALISIQAVLVNLFVTKEITLFGLVATASDALAIGISLSLNLLVEYYKQESAQKAIWVSFFCSLSYVVFSLFHVAYIPSSLDSANSSFIALLTPMPRIIAASLFVYILIQSIDCRLYSYLCNRFNSRYFILRNYSSVGFTQLLDTILFSFLGLYGINASFNSVTSIIQIIIISYSIKLIALFIAVPFLAFTKKLIKT